MRACARVVAGADGQVGVGGAGEVGHDDGGCSRPGRGAAAGEGRELHGQGYVPMIIGSGITSEKVDSP